MRKPRYLATVAGVTQAWTCCWSAANTPASRTASLTFGHTYLSREYIIGATRAVSNPKGYGPKVRGKVRQNFAFDENFVMAM